MKKIKILHVVGARPNFMKVAPVIRAISRYKKFRQILVHTGQHYDANMSDIFFKQLEIPTPDYNLEVGSGTHTVQTAEIMMRFERVLSKEKPDLVLVYGDVNSTVAAALVCAKNGVKLGHVEAGLRSFDRTMPEEINRMVTDGLADYLFTPSLDGNKNLQREGVSPKKIFFAGNVMIDTLVRLLPQAKTPKIVGLGKNYLLVTLHRPSNVDDPKKLKAILSELVKVSRSLQVLFPIHPRTRERLKQISVALPKGNQLIFTEPLGYLEFLALERDAQAVLTDSGGVQEETTYLGVPCFTLRANTERPVTLKSGTNQLLGAAPKNLSQKILKAKYSHRRAPAFWDGKASDRIAHYISRNTF